MKPILITLAALTIATPALARGVHYTAPHVTKSGTFVQGHMSTNPNRTRTDNWSSSPNVNPYTGKVGTVDPFAAKLPRRSRSRW